MRTNKKCIDLIKKHEGYRDKAYVCPSGVPTIGYGHTKGVTEGMSCTKEQAESWLLEDIERAEKQVDKYNTTYNFSENEYSALVSFAFNIGSIEQLTAKGTRTKEQIKSALPKYNRGGGKVLEGLKKRRADELRLFCDNDKTKKVVTNGSPLRIRAQPNIQSNILARIPNGESVSILDNGYKWDKVFYKNVIGYVSNKYLKG